MSSKKFPQASISEIREVLGGVMESGCSLENKALIID